MSRPHFKYYGEVKKRIRGYRPGRQINTIMQGIYDIAIDRALAETERKQNGEARIKVIKYVLVNGHSFNEAAHRYYYSPETIVRWSSEFVNLVALYSGNLESHGSRH